MIAANKTEQREWCVNQKDIVPTRVKEGKCKKCGKLLSQYNLNRYCFTHIRLQILEDDIIKQEKLRQWKYLSDKKRKLNANTSTNSKRTKSNSKEVF